ncbi:hypothetical protein SAMN03080598_01077 [Algoriphagus boritolerans DSM 17298 = JCM 18970]|uniref:Uncharacterized protein n=1 Tax=Algoriphagus boritolerans DSM 17298 = JCM 18970 TaxID=1120964 RepID=A0A1H5U6H0_9BACT|nr:hypothetical protein SAMN03080598_01077 [Algoriphagus boritolerans DSM 17298 = JCM 18970]
MVEGKRYEIIFTRSAILRYQNEVYPYLNSNFGRNRVFEIDFEIFEKIETLEYQPHRSSREKTFVDDPKEVRFLLYRASRNFELKILFFVDELTKKVTVTDFFPTRMNPTRMKS